MSRKQRVVYTYKWGGLYPPSEGVYNPSQAGKFLMVCGIDTYLENFAMRKVFEQFSEGQIIE